MKNAQAKVGVSACRGYLYTWALSCAFMGIQPGGAGIQGSPIKHLHIPGSDSSFISGILHA